MNSERGNGGRSRRRISGIDAAVVGALILLAGTACQSSLHVGSAHSDGGAGVGGIGAGGVSVVGVGGAGAAGSGGTASGGAGGATQPSKLSFAGAFRFAPAHSALNFALGDLNGDGKGDVVTVEAAAKDGILAVRMNEGAGWTTGTFYDFPGGLSPTMIGDLDGDGKPDVVGLSGKPLGSPNDEIWVEALWNDGSGALTSWVVEHFASNPIGGSAFVAMGDLDGDGLNDLAVMLSAPGGADESISVLLNQGGRQFKRVDSLYAIPGNPVLQAVAMAIGDLDGDGKGDLVITSSGAQIYVLHSQGNGVLSAPAFLAGMTAPAAILLGDVNADGRPDLVEAGSAPGVNVWLNDGSGGFAQPVAYPVVGQSIALGDVDGDGRPDLVAAGNGQVGADRATVLVNRGAGSFSIAGSYGLARGSSERVALADLNGDGKLDVAADNGAELFYLLNDGKGGLVDAPIVAADSDPRRVAVADLDGDGKPDLALANQASGDVSVALNNGDGTFAAAVNYPVGSSPMAVSVADVDSDGRPDLVVASVGSAGVAVLRNTGAGVFAPAVNHAVSSQPVALAVGDFDGDGRPDLAVVDAGDGLAGRVNVLLNAGGGDFGAPSGRTVGILPTAIAMGDLNGDGHLDLIVANGNTSTVSVLLNNGHGGFPTAANRQVGGFPRSVATADLNGDGYLDLITANVNGMDLTVLLGQGDGSFMPPIHTPLGIMPVWAEPADLDGDGRIDLAVVSTNASDVQLLLNDGQGGLIPAGDYCAGPGPVSAAAKDLNGDGKLDFVVVNAAGASVFMNTTAPPR